MFAGAYRIHPVSTGLCLGEGPELWKDSGRTVIGQHPCASASPQLLLEHVQGTTYLIKLNHPTYGIGCVTIDEQGRGDGLLLSGANCGSGRTDQRYVIEPVSAPAAGYRIHSATATSYCIGLYQDLTISGNQVLQTRCDGGRGQVFTFERAF